MNTNHSLFIFAGERSGDMHGRHLLSALRKRLPGLRVSGVGGPRMRAESMDCVLQMEDFEVMGLTDVLRALPRLMQHFYLILDHILKTNPRAIILIDYPGFNLRLAKALRKKGFRGKIIHYIAPAVWAHGGGRIRRMAETLDMLMIIYPFEADCFASSALPVAYVGNPLQEYICGYRYEEEWAAKAGIDKGKPLMAIFPGSRQGEVRRNLPAMLQAAAMLQKDHPEIVVAVSSTHSNTKELMAALLSTVPLKNVHLVPAEYTYEMMRDSHSAIAKSGTVTLELALHERPTVVVYRLGFLNWLYAKVVLRLSMPYYCIVNIIKGNGVFPELMGRGFSADNIYRSAKAIYVEGERRQRCLEGCKEVKGILKGYNASEMAAAKILEVLC